MCETVTQPHGVGCQVDGQHFGTGVYLDPLRTLSGLVEKFENQQEFFWRAQVSPARQTVAEKREGVSHVINFRCSAVEIIHKTGNLSFSIRIFGKFIYQL